ncbi:MAG TPA: tRNA uridine-5-carboxymethylaminomethyl(34) synthesis GTPase MnmE, partial [Marinilabiliales bacterium]|nr:tRNA uridine-5-carboxymethylaminomethyl(34) synthesis GTPase MnmE [Marinilabiliales bacterium]
MIKSDTIVAAATAHGHAGIAVVRISGNKALDLARKIFGSVNKNACPVLKHGRVFPGAIYWKGQLVDRVLGTVFKAPRSYTGEDTFEISCHGNPLVVEKVLRCAIESGARPANPGEFTRRAFLNNKMDLVQAEAVAHLIHADSDQAYRIALDHLQGTLSQRYTLLKEKLTSLLCGIEAAIDFPEEEVPLFNPASGKKEFAFIKGIISAMIASYQTGKKIAQGVRVAIIGPPNAGKSSLFNALCEKERVIVHEHPGTTRDTVEETITIEGMKITLIDTAGIWKSSNPVEARGIARAKDAAKRADLSLVVFDAGKPCAKNEAGLF